METIPRDVARENTLELVCSVMRALRCGGCATWLCGGWAEELYGWSAARAHGDIDLVHPARDLGRVDAFLRDRPDVSEITQKRFTHKRAFEVGAVMVEVVLVERDGAGHFTDCWGLAKRRWPEDLLAGLTRPVPTVGEAALRAARAGWSAKPDYSTLTLERRGDGVLVPVARGRRGQPAGTVLYQAR